MAILISQSKLHSVNQFQPAPHLKQLQSYLATGDPLVAGTQVAVHIKAVNGTFSKESTPATMTVADALPTNPIENYDVPAPLVIPAVEDDKSVKGHVNLATPIPANTTFKALVTY
ncbi:hypothetical protein [Latilactobacillus curvatus]